jgi:hypothetical protein
MQPPALSNRPSLLPGVLLASALASAACSNGGDRGEAIGHVAARVVQAGPPMGTIRTHQACALLGSGEAIVLGGYTPGPPEVATVEAYDPVKKVFTALPSMVKARLDASAVQLSDGSVLIAGGDDAKLAEVFDVTARAWTSGGTMGSQRARLKLARMRDGRVITTGGEDGGVPALGTEIFDPATRKWSAGPPMNGRHRVHDAIAFVGAKSGVLVAGDDVKIVGEVLYDGATSWLLTDVMSAPRVYPALGRLADGRVIVTGGYTDTTETAALSTTEIYDPKTNAWSPGPKLNHARGGHAAVSLASGAIVVAGGESSGAVERLDAGGTKWTDVGVMADAREGLCGEPIPGGAIFYAGLWHDVATEATSIYLGDAAGAACTNGDGCASGACVQGKCGALVVDAGVDAAPPEAGAPAPITQPFQRCARNADCATGHCVDGVCCDAPCTEACHSCALPGKIGTCAQEPLGVDLRGECGAALACTGTCGASGQCIGAVPGSQCAAPRCVSASAGVGAATCSAFGARCPTDDATRFDCGAYACEPALGACLSSCTTTTDCAGGYLCDTDQHACVQPATAASSSGGCTVGGVRAPRVGGGLCVAIAALAVLGSIARRARRVRRRVPDARRVPCG